MSASSSKRAREKHAPEETPRTENLLVAALDSLDEQVQTRSGSQSPDAGPDPWLREQILVAFGPIVSHALLTSSHAHGARCNEWLCEQIEAPHPEIVFAYQERLLGGAPEDRKLREEQANG